MADIRIAQVDERDSNWELSSPTFRVYLHGSGPDSTEGFTDTYDITGRDVLQVIDWAQRQAADSLTYAVALVVDDEATEQRSPGHARGLIWLVGTDGNADVSRDPEGATTHQRMLQRRAHPIRVGEADEMPTDVPDPYNV
ncbi:hypothetical protein [Nocardioides dongkuii]|uniref:hypothetical protein n=1 Tax=Nocardioides dongkuii TaxID=2760089 RepID=UPI0015FDC208|nr:hypothetical protein [Nocardioides dongkuii]